MQINIINNHNISLLEKFIKNKLSNNFRYFEKRNINIINNHYITIIGTINDIPIGYGHIDIDNNIYWLGICILEEYHGNGYGKYIMNYLINKFNESNVQELYLTVDKNNIVAIKLYEKYNFKIIKDYDYYYKMLLKK